MSASSSLTSATIAGMLNAAPSTVYTIQFYASTAADAGGFAEGQTFLGSTTVTTNPAGQANISFGLAAPIPSGQLVTATATDPLGNVSEFSPSVVAAGATLSADLGVTVAPSASPVLAGTAQTYTVTVTNSSSSSIANGVVLTDVLPAGATFMTATATQGSTPTQSGDVVTAALGTINPGASATVMITVTAGPSGNVPVTDIASVTSALPDPSLANNVASVSTTVTPMAAVTLAITPPAINPAIEGQNETWTVTIANAGPNDAANVVLSDTLPLGVTIVSEVPSIGLAPVISAGTGGNPSTMVTTIGTLPAGFTATLTFIATTLPAAVPALNFTASVTTTTPDQNTTDNTASTSTPVLPVASLAVAIAAPSPELISQNLTYNVTVTNSGPNAASNVVLTDTLPTNATFVSGLASASQGQTPTISAGVLTANLGTLLANSIATVTITVIPNAFPSIVNSVSVTSATTSPVVVTATNTTTVSTNADISVAVVSSPVPAQVGQPLVYTVTVTNNGPSTASNVVLVNTQDPNVTFVSATDTAAGKPAFAAGNVTTNVGNLISGAFAIVTITVMPNGAAAILPPTSTLLAPVITDTATANSTPLGTTGATLDPNAANNAVTVTSPVLAESHLTVTLVPSFTVTPSITGVLAGGDLTYTATIKNTGPNVDTNVTFSDKLDGNVAYVATVSSSSTTGVTQNLTGASSTGAGGTVTGTIPTLAAGATDIETIVVTPLATAVPSSMNTFSVTGDNFDPNSLSKTPTNTVTNTTAVAPSADLLVLLNQSATSALDGQQLTYTIDVTNFGPSDATGVILTDLLPASTTLVSATSTVGAAPQVGTTGLVANISALANGQTAVITIVITPLAAAVPSITDSVSVASTTTDADTVNNTANLTTSVAADSDLTLTVVPSATSVQVGQNLTYTYTVVNNGPNDATTTAITDPLPTGMSFVSGTVSVAGIPAAAPTLVGSTVVANLGTLTNGSTAIVTIVLSPGEAALPAIVNVTTVGSALIDPNPADDTVITTTPVTALADVGVTITGPTRHRARGPEPDVHDHRHQQRSDRRDWRHHQRRTPLEPGVPIGLLDSPRRHADLERLHAQRCPRHADGRLHRPGDDRGPDDVGGGPRGLGCGHRQQYDARPERGEQPGERSDFGHAHSRRRRDDLGLARTRPGGPDPDVHGQRVQ